MPAVRVEDDAFGDTRYERLAHECGLADGDHARGKMLRLWRQCTAEGRYHLDRADVEMVLGPRGVDGIVAARLGVLDGDRVRIRGTKGRIEWLKKLRDNGKKGGRPRKTNRKPSGFREPNPLVTAPALDPATAQIPERETAPPPPLALVAQEPKTEAKPDAVDRLWAEQERLRSEVLPGSFGLKLTRDRRKRIAQLLDSGYAESDLVACQRAYASEARSNGGRWFNGDTNWRPDNVARTLGQIGTSANPNAAARREPTRRIV